MFSKIYMSKFPLISIQIPTYSQEQYIKQALDSALAQTYENLQVIVSDDCSPDYDIFEYLREYKDNPKVIIHRNEKNLGRVGNYRNTLYNLVQGDWFVNLDGDDFFINSNFVSTALVSISKSSEKIAAFQAHATIRKIEENNIPHVNITDNIYVVRGLDYLQYINDSLGFTHASVLYNVNDARNCDFYNINTLDIDYFSYLKILTKGYIIFWNEKVYNWRQHDNQETHRLDFEECKIKFSEYEDLVLFYKAVPNKYKMVMFQKTYYDLTLQLMVNLFKQKFNFQDLIFVLKKMNFELKYLKPFLSLLKNRIVTV